MSVVVIALEDLKDLLDQQFKTFLSKVPAAAGDNKPAEIIDTAVLCSRLNLTEATIIRHRKQGKIPFLKVGTSIRYNWPEVIRVLENKKAKR